MKKVVLAAVFAVAVFAVSSTVNATPNETNIDKDKYEIPPNG